MACPVLVLGSAIGEASFCKWCLPKCCDGKDALCSFECLDETGLVVDISCYDLNALSWR